ncbi:MAG: SUMF1/EgtB/PvdO family nonheme iron enzyme [Candidatus Cloacimonetes bacterium]|nr:SUMF1/EgtB/PvdO family nonheme iron enzyme [Candidatus Cloacimonadota bacterium]
MKNIMICCVLLFAISSLIALPQVYSVTASQRTDASKKVDIYYNVSHYMPVTVSLQASYDNEQSWSLSCNLISGDVGANISPGNGKHIVWDVLAEHPNVIYEHVRFKVFANDGQTPPAPANFVFIPSGSFIMGDSYGVGSSSELPTHNVTLNSYFIGKYEVTQSEWASIMGSNPASGYGRGDNYPVYYISWYAILKYCNLRSIAEGLAPVYSINGSTNPVDWGAVPTSGSGTWNAAICYWSANGYRLPTEAEWEYAARCATNTPDYLYSGSDDINAVAWYGSNSSNITHLVGTKAPNGFDLYDMSGNVRELCWDFYEDSYYSSSPSNNPTGPSSGSQRVIRGGYWYNSAIRCRIADRMGYLPYSSYGTYSFAGFRLCRSEL